jgi:hydrogenase maturation protease
VSAAGNRIAVIGLGNVLMGDDAFGPHVACVLDAGWDCGERVTVLDLGTPGLDLTPFISDVDYLVIVDTVRSEGAPGELRCYRRDQILRHPPGPRLSPHDPGVKEALLFAEFAGAGPREVLLVGVIPASTAQGLSLSPAVRAAVAPALLAVFAELARLGVAPQRRPGARPPDLWWEAEPDRHEAPATL